MNATGIVLIDTFVVLCLCCCSFCQGEILKQYRLGLVPEEFITSKTCKGLYMRLRRQMEKDDADVNFPQMSKMFAGSTKEKLGLLRSFLQNGENAKACETQIRLEKTWEHEYEGKEELLTVREMRTWHQ